jgi:hypothetical protein
MATETDLSKPGVLVIAPNKWGKGQSIQAAMKAGFIRRSEPRIVYAVPFALKDIWVTDMGDVCWEKKVPAQPFRIEESKVNKT